MDAQLLKIKKQMIRAIGLIDSNKIENIGRAKGLLEMLVKEVDHEEKLFLAFKAIGDMWESKNAT